METWRYGKKDMNTWRYRHGDMETWRNGDMETWKHRDMETWTGNMDRKHGQETWTGNMDIESWDHHTETSAIFLDSFYRMLIMQTEVCRLSVR